MTIRVEDITEEELLAMTKHLFRQWSIEEDVSIEKGLYACKVKDFVVWCITTCENDPTRIEVEKTGMVERLGVRPSAVDALEHLFTGDPWVVAGVMIPIWPMLVLQHRPPSKNALAFVHVALGLGYRDEKVVQIQGGHHVAPGATIVDGFLVAMLQDMSRQMINTIAEHGADKMHDEFSQEVVENESDLRPPVVIPPAATGQLGF